MSNFESPEQWLSCVTDFDAAGNYTAETMVHEVQFVEEGGKFLRQALDDRDRFTAELQAVRNELAAAGPSCERCQSSHCCSVAGSTPPLCVTDPDGSLPLWMPWTNEEVGKRVYAVYAQVDALQAELARVRRNHLRRMLEDAELGREYYDGFQDQPIGEFGHEWRNRCGKYARFADKCRAALANNAKDGT